MALYVVNVIGIVFQGIFFSRVSVPPQDANTIFLEGETLSNNLKYLRSYKTDCKFVLNYSLKTKQTRTAMIVVINSCLKQPNFT